jgi:homocysteine S-methyltransferase
MDRDGFRTLLAGGPVPSDGGTGTALIARGIPVAACFEALNVDSPVEVEEVHAGFVRAGARIVLSNTFGGSRFRLAHHGRTDRVGALNRAGVSLTRRAGAEFVGGSMGPLGVRLAPYGRITREEAFAAYLEQAQALAEAGVDLFWIETQTDLREALEAVAAARAAEPSLPVVASVTFSADDRMPLGATPSQAAAALAEAGVDALGVNCGEGPAQAIRIVRAMRPHAEGIPLVARPNAGGPASIGGRFVYPATPDYVARSAEELVAEGAGVIGGCCGTGPEHVAAIVRSLEDPTAVAVGVSAIDRARDDERSEPVRALPPTSLQRSLEEGRFVVAVEMEPPRSFDPATLVAAAQTLRDAGADAIDVADSPMAKMRMSAWAACRAIQDGAGIETVLHFPTRGRNLLRLQGDLLGAHALGIRNLFVCVGDPVAVGDYPQALNEIDVTATGLLAMIRDSFNVGTDRGGSSIGEPTAFVAGAAVAPNALDLERECRLLAKKVRAGARFLLSQPLFTPASLARLREVYELVAGEPLRVPLLAGVLPLATVRHAEFLHNEVPGIEIPSAVRDRMRGAGEGGWAEGARIAGELVAELRDAGVAGVYVMPQFGRYDRAAEVVEAISAG